MCREFPPMSDPLMATYLVRWWKTKILSGYKQFTAVLPADCGDGRPSDTEELLKVDFDPPPTTPPPPPPPATPPPTTPPPTSPAPPPDQHANVRRELNFEGFECDVSLEGTGDPTDRQEFSFTLYDFDGHGKITKDDIAGLVTTIYETLGSSIKVPHYGSKTIKVRLTVSPDQPPATAPSEPPPPATQQPPPPRRYKRDLNVTIRERRRRPVTRRHSVSSSAASEDREADVSEEEEPPHCRLGHTTSCRLGSSQSRSKKRSSSLQRQELLQIIQANMEKNNLCFKTSRKHCSPGHDVSRHKAPQCWGEKCGGRGKGREEAPPVPPRPAPAPAPTTPHHHHHLKHRHREQEQARAMAQVVRWLEREFSPSRNGKSPPYQRHKPLRTEHHHVHEHVHHHYHHYQDTPVLV